MNKSQKILTVTFLVLVSVMLLWFPCITAESGVVLGYYQSQYRLILGEASCNPDWRKVAIEGVLIIVLYVGLFVVLKSPSK